MLIYLDLCCFNRPFDDQGYKTIILETEAKLFIQEMIKDGTLDLTWSYILEYENNANPDIDIIHSLFRWKALSKKHIFQEQSIIDFAKKLNSKGFGIKDSLHIACSINANAKFFITTDKDIMKKSELVSEIKIINPIDFIKIIEGDSM